MLGRRVEFVVDQMTLGQFITTSIPVNRMDRRLEGNIGKCAVVGSVTTQGEYREVRCSGERNNSRGI
jgi:hypothetical protein